MALSVKHSEVSTKSVFSWKNKDKSFQWEIFFIFKQNSFLKKSIKKEIKL